MEIPESVLLAVIAAVGGGIALVYKDLRTDLRFYRERMPQALDNTDHALAAAKQKAGDGG